MSRSDSLGKMLSEGSNGEAIENGVNIYKAVIGIFFFNLLKLSRWDCGK